MSVIPYGRQHITDDDIQAVVEVLRGDYLTQGPKIAQFEADFAAYVGAPYAVAVSNGTAALHLSVLAMGIAPGQKVITTPITFAASANCVRYAGGEVVFADIDPLTYLLDIEAVRSMIEAAPAGTYAGIIPVDFAGRSVDMEAWRSLADAHGLWLIEDACHAPGGYFNNSQGKPTYCGNGQYANAAIFSFHPVKHIATGEGGMITTADRLVYERLITLRTHGITRQSDTFVNSPQWAAGTESTEYPGWYMEMQELGYNYRLTDFQAALGSSQLRRAQPQLERRRQLAANYAAFFTSKPYVKGQSGVVDGHAYHLYVLEVSDRLGLYNYLKTQQIFAQIHYIPCHLMPYYRQLGWKEGDLPSAERYYQHCISIPMYPSMTDAQQQLVMRAIDQYYLHD